MAIGDSISLTIGAGTKTLVKVKFDGYASEYRLIEADRSWTLNVRNTTYVKAGVTIARHNAELVESVYATATVPAYERKQYDVFEHPLSITTGVSDDVKGLHGFLSAANIAKIINFES